VLFLNGHRAETETQHQRGEISIITPATVVLITTRVATPTPGQRGTIRPRTAS
jgi:hypothetical protein